MKSVKKNSIYTFNKLAYILSVTQKGFVLEQIFYINVRLFFGLGFILFVIINFSCSELWSSLATKNGESKFYIKKLIWEPISLLLGG